MSTELIVAGQSTEDQTTQFEHPPKNRRTAVNSELSSSYFSSTYNHSSVYSRKSESGYVGLTNQGATCYLNSLFQTPFMTPEFRNTLYDWQYEDSNKTTIPAELKRLFISLQTSSEQAIETD